MPIMNTTPYYGIALPNSANDLSFDVGQLISALGTIDSALHALAGGSSALSAVQTASFTAAASTTYPCNTTSAAITVTLPAAPSAGDQIVLIDYARTFPTNILTINPNAKKINGSTSNVIINTSGASVALIYIDATQGWLCISGFAASPIGQYTITHITVAGGGGGGYEAGGGGGGGVVYNTALVTPGTALTVTVGAGGAAGTISTSGSNGGTSSISSVSSASGGGGGGTYNANGSIRNGQSGGSGGGSGVYNGSLYGTPGSGTSGQGYAGGSGAADGASYANGGGGGGAGGAGGGCNYNGPGGSGGVGIGNAITGSIAYYGGGGGGGTTTSGAGGLGGNGGGGNGAIYAVSAANAGTANTGGGGGGGSDAAGAAGGSGIGIICYISATQRGSGGTVTQYTVGPTTFWLHTFTTSGTYTA